MVNGTGNKIIFTETGEVKEGSEASPLTIISETELPPDRPDLSGGRKKRKYKKKTEEPPIVFEKISFVPIVKMSSDFLAKRKGDEWRMSEGEIDQFSGCIAKLATKYGGAFINWQEEIAMLAVCSVYYLSRTMFKPARQAPAGGEKSKPKPEPQKGAKTT